VELGPVLTALVVAGRVGAAMAAELGTMRVTEQLDAMECLSLNPFQFLYAPRFFASTVMMPVLVILSTFTGLIGAMIVGWAMGLEPETFFNGVRKFFIFKDVSIGIFKAFVFGAIIALMGCFNGHTTSGGAEGVGIYTKKAVVASSVWILMADFLIVGLFL
ncbi:MAG: ABC transporter permease, partial [bacterium]